MKLLNELLLLVERFLQLPSALAHRPQLSLKVFDPFEERLLGLFPLELEQGRIRCSSQLGLRSRQLSALVLQLAFQRLQQLVVVSKLALSVLHLCSTLLCPVLQRADLSLQQGDLVGKLLGLELCLVALVLVFDDFLLVVEGTDSELHQLVLQSH